MKCKRPGEPESFRPPAAHALCHTPRRAACDVVAPNDPHLPAPAPLYDHLPPACAGPSDFPPSERGEGEGRSPLRAGDSVRPLLLPHLPTLTEPAAPRRAALRRGARGKGRGGLQPRGRTAKSCARPLSELDVGPTPAESSDETPAPADTLTVACERPGVDGFLAHRNYEK